MKIALSIVFISVVALGFVVLSPTQKSSAQQQYAPTGAAPVTEEPEPATPSKTLEDYEKVLSKFEEMTKNFMVFDSWKEIQFKHKTTNEIVKWEDLSDFQKTLFCITMGERVTSHFSKMNDFWNAELKQFDLPGHKLVPVPNPQNEKQKPATKEDVTKYIEKLTTIRKGFAVEYEKYVEKSFKTYEKEIPQAERDSLLKSIRDNHDKLKLVERK